MGLRLSRWSVDFLFLSFLERHSSVRPRAPRERSSALQSLPAMASAIFPFAAHIPCSTAPQAFPRPDRRMLTPARAGRVKAGRSSAVTVRLGLDTTEHDGTLSTIGRRLDQ
jgi:hypothetical protein